MFHPQKDSSDTVIKIKLLNIEQITSIVVLFNSSIKTLLEIYFDDKIHKITSIYILIFDQFEIQKMVPGTLEVRDIKVSTFLR